jgi:hypothetical protein
LAWRGANIVIAESGRFGACVSTELVFSLAKHPAGGYVLFNGRMVAIQGVEAMCLIVESD